MRCRACFPVCLVVGVSLFTSSAIASGPTLSEGLIAHYRLDDAVEPTVLDSVDSHDGTNHGAARGLSGRFGNAFQFNGTDSYIDTLMQGDIPTTATISVWVRPDSGTTSINPEGNQVFGSVEDASGGKDGILMNWFQGDRNVTVFYVESNIDQGGVTTPPNTVPFERWTNVVYSWDPVNNVRLYINGQLSAAGNFSSPPSSHDRALMFGKSILSQNLAFPGYMDDIRIWNRALSAEEVACIPEPSSLALAALVVMVLECRRKSQTKK